MFPDVRILLATPRRDAIFFVAFAPFAIGNKGLDPLERHVLMYFLRPEQIRNQAIFVNHEIGGELVVAAVASPLIVGSDIPNTPELFDF